MKRLMSGIGSLGATDFGTIHPRHHKQLQNNLEQKGATRIESEGKSKKRESGASVGGRHWCVRAMEEGLSGAGRAVIEGLPGTWVHSVQQLHVPCKVDPSMAILSCFLCNHPIVLVVMK